MTAPTEQQAQLPWSAPDSYCDYVPNPDPLTGETHDYSLGIRDANGDVAVNIRGDDLAVCQARRDLVVRAVNAHDELMAACEKRLAFLKLVGPRACTTTEREHLTAAIAKATD